MYKTASQIAYSVLTKLAEPYEERVIRRSLRSLPAGSLERLGFTRDTDDPTLFTSPIERPLLQRITGPVAAGGLGALGGLAARSALLHQYGALPRGANIALPVAGAAAGAGLSLLTGAADKYQTIRQNSAGQLKDMLLANAIARQAAARSGGDTSEE